MLQLSQIGGKIYVSTTFTLLRLTALNNEIHLDSLKIFLKPQRRLYDGCVEHIVELFFHDKLFNYYLCCEATLCILC